LPRRDDYGRATESHHRALKRRERAKRGIEEQQAQHFARQCLRLRMLLQTRSKSKEILDVLAREISQIEESVHSGQVL
jgi:hypothetical protein